MTRRNRSELFATVAVVVIAGLALAVAHQRNERNLREAAGVPASTPAPDDSYDADPTPMPAGASHFGASNAVAKGEAPRPTIVVPLDTNFDSLDEYCTRKLLAWYVRFGVPYLADERLIAAQRACPAEWSRP